MNAAYTLAHKDKKPSGTSFNVKDITIGPDTFTLIAGPCSVESRDQIMTCAAIAKEAGAHILRAGCFKPRTSPYSFQGLGKEGLQLLAEASEKYNIPSITEVGCAEDVLAADSLIDILQVGARNMQNFNLLHAVGRAKSPVFLKRGMGSTIEEFLLAAEHIMSEGQQNVILCERGIRTFEKSTRFTLDISAVPVIRECSHLPIFIDPSHASGRRALVPALAKAGKAAGAHGVMIEFHPDPDKALSDGQQSLTPEQFRTLAKELLL